MTTSARHRLTWAIPSLTMLVATGCAKKDEPQEEPTRAVVVPAGGDPAPPPRERPDPSPTRPAPREPAPPPPARPSKPVPTAPPPRVPKEDDGLDTLTARLRDPDARVRAEAARALGEMGPPAHPAISALAALLDDKSPEVTAQAARAITAVGRAKSSCLVDFSAAWCGPCRAMKPVVERLKADGLPVTVVDVDEHPELASQFKVRSVPTFVVIRRDKEWDRTTGAASEEFLRELLKGVGEARAAPAGLTLEGTAARARVAALLLALNGDDEWVKFLAEDEVRSPESRAIPVLASVLRGEYPGRLRAGAVKGLLAAHRGRKAPAEVTDLLKATAADAGESVDVRGYAGVALHGLKVEHPGTVPNLTAALREGTLPELRALAAQSLGELRVADAVPPLTAALDGESARVRKAAARALGVIGAPSAPAVPRLFRLYEAEPGSAAGEAAKQALAAIVPSADDASPALAAAMRSKEPPVRLLAVELLGTAAEPQPDMVAGLQNLLEDSDGGIRVRAAVALQRLGRADGNVLRALAAALKEEEENHEAGEALREAGRGGASVLVESIIGPAASGKQRLRSVRVFAGIDEPGRAAVAALTGALASKHPGVPTYSALALAGRTPQDPALLKPLEAGLGSPDRELRRECVQSLGATRSASAVAPLLAVLRTNDELRDPAAYALSQLPRDEKTVAELVRLLQAPRGRPAAARALAHLREHREAAARGLVAAFAAADEDGRDAIGDSLQSLGKPAAAWLVALFEDGTVREEVRLAALTLVGRMRDEAREAAPVLKKYLKDGNGRVRARAAIALAFLDPDADVTGLLLDVAERENDNPELRGDALDALRSLGPKAAGGVGRLVAWLKGPDENLRSAAVQTLPAVGRNSPEALSALVALLRTSQDANTRRSATYSLSAFRGKAAAELAKALADPGYSRADVIAALCQVGRDAGAAREPLAKVLGDRDRSLAVAAALAMSSVDPGEKAAVPALVEALRSPDRETRYQAMAALGQLGPLARPAVPELVRALEAQETRGGALYALSRIGPGAADAVEAVARLLNSREAHSAAHALGEIGPAAAPAVPKLLRMLRNERTAPAAASALAKIGGGAKEAVPLLVGKLGQEDGIIPACRALAFVGRLDVEQTLSALGRLASHPDPEVRAALAGTLGQLKSAKAVPHLTAALKDRELPVRLAAAGALGQLGLDAEPAVAALADALGATEPDMRRAAAWALGGIGPKAGAAVPSLVKALSDKGTRSSAAYAIGRIGAAAGPAVPRLAELLNDPELRHEVAYALGLLGPVAKAALPRLQSLAKDPDARFAKAAAAAAARIEGKVLPPDDDPD